MRHSVWMVLGLSFAGLAHAEPVVIRAADGVQLAGDLRGNGARSVLIVPDEGETQEKWLSVADTFVKAGLRVLVMDLRGQGASKGAADDDGWKHMGDDVVTAIGWLRARKGVTDVALIGSGAGAVLVAEAAAYDAKVERIMLISPVLKAHDHSIAGSLSSIAARNIWILTAPDDSVGVRTAGALASRLTGPHRVLREVQGSRGSDFFAYTPKLAGEVAQWLLVPEQRSPDQPLTTGDFTPVETTGTAFGK